MLTINNSADIYDLGFKGAIVLVIGSIVSLFLPLAAPDADTQAAALWLNQEAGAYLFGWLNQLMLVFAIAVTLAVAGWAIYQTAPLRAITVWSFTLISTGVFFITKFFALWGVPLMAKAIAAESAVQPEATAALLALAPNESFGLLGSLDWLGFWIYGLIGILMFRPLFRGALSAKIAAGSLLLFGVVLPLLFTATLIDILGQDEFGEIAFSTAALLTVAGVAFAIFFRSERDLARPSENV